MTKPQKSAREKLMANHGLPKVVAIPPKMQKRFGKGKMLVPSPIVIDRAVRKVKKGKLITPSLIRQMLAKEFKADTCCPLTTGIFLRICAEAAEEELSSGKKQITPWWRVVKDNGELLEKFPGATEKQAKKLKAEGFEIIEHRGKTYIKNFEQFLITKF